MKDRDDIFFAIVNLRGNRFSKVKVLYQISCVTVAWAIPWHYGMQCWAENLKVRLWNQL